MTLLVLHLVLCTVLAVLGTIAALAVIYAISVLMDDRDWRKQLDKWAIDRDDEFL